MILFLVILKNYLEATMSRANLEQILELLLAEENDRAEEMLHEYVVSKARAEYEKVLDEGEEVEVEESAEEEVEEAIDQSNDFEDDILADEEEIEADELGEAEDEEEMDMDMDMDMDAEEEGEEEAEEEGEDDIEDKVDDLEAELEELRAEFEKLLADEMEEPEHADMEMDSEEGEEEMMDSVEYDLEEAEEIEEDEEVVEEATKLSDKEARQPLDGKGVEADSTESPLSKKPKDTKVAGAGAPVKAKDGSEGVKGGAAKDHTPTDNIKVEPKKA